MSEHTVRADAEPSATATRWKQLADADPIAVRDPLAELLGMVPEGEPLVFTFADVAAAAGHACPAVAGAYRATQLALDALYVEDYPVRSEIRVTVGGRPDESGFGPMADVMSHVTGASDERGFTGFGAYGERDGLLSFDPSLGGSGARTFAFSRIDTDERVRVAFDPGRTERGTGPGEEITHLIPRLVSGDATAAERDQFHDVWRDRVERVLAADPGPESPFDLTRSA